MKQRCRDTNLFLYPTRLCVLLRGAGQDGDRCAAVPDERRACAWA